MTDGTFTRMINANNTFTLQGYRGATFTVASSMAFDPLYAGSNSLGPDAVAQSFLAFISVQLEVPVGFDFHASGQRVA
jgi:hypothetical protein